MEKYICIMYRYVKSVTFLIGQTLVNKIENKKSS